VCGGHSCPPLFIGTNILAILGPSEPLGIQIKKTTDQICLILWNQLLTDDRSVANLAKILDLKILAAKYWFGRSYGFYFVVKEQVEIWDYHPTK
jgi:hypothetical protein